MNEFDHSQVNFQMRTVFLIGQTENEEVQNQLYDESEKHDDLIQERFVDSYYNLTLKAAMMMKWVNTNCINKGIFIQN